MRLSNLMISFLFFFFFGFFLVHLSPTVSTGDSGELIAATSYLGIPHPPGYPLYNVLANLFTYVPLGNIAFRINIFSSFFSTLTVILVFMIASRLIEVKGLKQSGYSNEWRKDLYSHGTINTDGFAAFICIFTAATCLALSPTFQGHAERAEVYSLNSFFSLLLFWIFLSYYQGIRNFKILLLGAFLFGLGLGNHHTLLLMVPGLVFLLLPVGRVKSTAFPVKTFIEQRTGNVLRYSFVLLLFFLLGFSINLYLPVRSSQNPLLDWGTPDTLTNLVDVLMRKGYETKVYYRSIETLFQELRSFNLIYEFGLPALLIMMVGFYRLWKKDSRLLLSLITCITSFSFLIIFLAGNYKGPYEVLTPFYIPAYTFLSIFICLGLYHCYLSAKAKTFGGISLSLLMIVLLLDLGMAYSRNRANTDLSDNFLAYNYGFNEMNSFKENALYLPKVGSNTFVLWYLQKVEKYREDVDIVPVYFLTQKWYLPQALKYMDRSYYHDPYRLKDEKRAMMNSLFKKYYDKRDIYSGYIDDEYMPKGVNAISNGISFKLSGTHEAVKSDPWNYYRLAGVKRINDSMDHENKQILENYASAYYNLGLEYYREEDMDKAMRGFEKALSIQTDNADTLNNLALIYADKKINLEKAAIMARQAVELYDVPESKYQAIDTLAWVYYRMERYEEAYKKLQSVERFMDNDSYFHYHQGMILFKLRKFELAREALLKSQTIENEVIKKDLLNTLREIDSFLNRV